MHAPKQLLFVLLLTLCCALASPAVYAAETTPAAKQDAPKPDAGKADAPKADTAKPDAPKPDAAKPDTPKADAPKADTAKSDTGKTDAGKTDAKKDSAKADKQDKSSAKADAKADAKEAKTDDKAVEPKDGEAPIPTLPLRDPWEMVWSGQKTLLDEITQKATAMGDTFVQRSTNLSEKVQPFMEEARRLLVLLNTYKNWPNPVEAVSRRITSTVLDLRKVLDPVMGARTEVQALLERVGYLADSMPEDLHDGSLSPEMQEYAKTLVLTRLRLTAVMAQYDSALAPALALIKRLEKMQEEINAQIPLLWKNYYLQSPVPWLSPDAWADFGRQMHNSVQGMILRLPVEIPVTAERWGTAMLRFVVCLLLTGVLTTLLYRRWASHDTVSGTVRHIFRVSLPWLCVGLALLGSSLSASGEFFRLFLALGNLCLIVAQIHLAWDLRLLKYPEVQQQKPPFWILIQPTLCSYVLLYLPLTKPLVLVIWLGIVIASIVRQHRRPKLDLGPLHVETSVLECEPMVLWICLVLTLGGLHIYSMVLYLLFVSCSLALQLCLGGMALVSSLNDRLPQEGVRAALAHLAVALSAPVVLVAAIVGVSQWVGTLPGGMYLLQHYVLRGVNVGATQFNIVHLLLIITMFYLTRTAVAMGSRFLARLPKQGLAIDATLIPPMQTAFTYALWCCFGLFVLRALGMELSNLAMVAGGLSVGIGFGMQTIVNNFLSGLILIFSRTLQAGDVVEVGGTQGRVRKISVRATMVETFDNALIIVPNSEFVASRLINWTRNSRTVRREIKVGVAYGSDADQVMKILLAMANANSNVLKYPPPSVAFADFGASTLDFSLRFWVRDYDVAVSTASDIRVEIEREFREQHIDIAFPQLDVNIKELPPLTKTPLPSVEPRTSKRRAPRRPRRVLPAPAKSSKPGGKNAPAAPPAATPDDGDDDENS